MAITDRLKEERKMGKSGWGVRMVAICVIAVGVLIGGGIAPGAAEEDGTSMLGFFAPKTDAGADQEAFATAQGTATYRVPIALPPGRGGMKPSLALVYNSADLGSGGLLGAGWHLTGLGSIERRGSNWAGVPKYDGNDTFVMGGQKLVYAGVDPSGETGNYYRTQIENFTRIVYNTVFNLWVVFDKSGTTYFFDWRLEDRGGRGTQAWYLTRAEDRHGNYWEVVYGRMNAGGIGWGEFGVVKPMEIKYASGAVKVDLGYEGRPDVTTSYRLGSKLVTDERLTSVSVFMSGALVNRYNIGYTQSPDSRRSLVSQVQQVGADGATALPTVRFTYSTTPKGWTLGPAVPVDLGTRRSADLISTADINRDGRADMVRFARYTGSRTNVWLNTGSGWAEDANWRSSFVGIQGDTDPWKRWRGVADLNGDGLGDIYWCEDTDSNGMEGWVRIYSNTGSGWPGVPALDTGGAAHPLCYEGNRLADINGDGLVDIIVANNDGGLLESKYRRREAWLNNGNWNWTYDATWSASIDDPVVFHNYWAGSDNIASVSDTGVRLADVNGDGLPDLVRLAVDTNYQGAQFIGRVHLNTGRGWEYSSEWSAALPWSDFYYHPFPTMFSLTMDGVSSLAPAQFMDVNQDGLPDLVYAYNRPDVDDKRRVYINTGSGWVRDGNWEAALPAWLANSCGNTTEDNPTNEAACSGSNNPSICELKRDSQPVWEASLRAREDADWIHPPGSGGGAYDINRCDLNSSNGDTWLSSAEPPDRLLRVDNPLGGSTTIAWTTASQYDNTGGDGLSDLGFAKWIIQSVTHDNGLGQSMTTTMSYSGGLYKGYPDREFRGFRTVRATDATGAYTETWYHQDGDKKGLVEKVEARGSAGTLFARTTYGYTTSIPVSGVYRVDLTAKVVETYDGGSTAKSVTTIYPESGVKSARFISRTS